jgi:hypothetical protein
MTAAFSVSCRKRGPHEKFVHPRNSSGTVY